MSPYSKSYGPQQVLAGTQPGQRKRASSKRGAQFQPLTGNVISPNQVKQGP